MSTEQKRILEMVAEGKITPAEADQLLGAVRRPRPALWEWMFTPFELLTTRNALLVSGAVALLQLVISRFGVRFDGALDSHVGSQAVPWWVALIDLGVAWPLTALLFWGVFRIVARQGRFVDALAAVGIARLPLLASGALSAAFKHLFLGATAGQISPGLVILSLLLIPFVVWLFVLLVTGMRSISGLRGVKLAFTFFGAVVLAEVVTKLVLFALR